MGMYVPKSPTAPESSEKRVVFSLTEEGSHRLRGRRGVVVVDISRCSSEIEDDIFEGKWC